MDNYQDMIDELESQYQESSVHDHQRRIELLFRTIHILIQMIYYIRKEKNNG